MIEYDSVRALTVSGEINIQAFSTEIEKVAVVAAGVATFHDLRKESTELIATTDQEVVSRSDYGLVSSSINRNVNFKSWLTGIYAFDDVPIEQVLSTLSKQNPNPDVKSTEIDRNRLISGVFHLDVTQQTKEQILQVINDDQIFWK